MLGCRPLQLLHLGGVLQLLGLPALPRSEDVSDFGPPCAQAAEGKRANATAMRRAKRRAGQMALRADAVVERPTERQAAQDEEDEEAGDGEDDLEAKLANTKDEKEAKRLKRCAVAAARSLGGKKQL